MRGFSVRKSSCKERTRCMQHHMSSEAGGVSGAATTIPSTEAGSPCPAASANMTGAMQHSASLRDCDFVQDPHFPTCFVLRSSHIVVYMSQTDLRSCRMTFIPFGCPLGSRLGGS